MKKLILIILFLIASVVSAQNVFVGKTRVELIHDLGKPTQVDSVKNFITYESTEEYHQYIFGGGQYKNLVVQGIVILRYPTYNQTKRNYVALIKDFAERLEKKESQFGDRFENDKFRVTVYFINDPESRSLTVMTSLK